MNRGDEPSLVDKIVSIHDALERAGIRHAFGGALALAHHVHEPRATADIDVNVSVGAERTTDVFAALPPGVAWNDADVSATLVDEQRRLWWGRTPVDLFFRASAFHDDVADRAVDRPFADRTLPYLAATDLTVFKALFDRPKDWVDIASMVDAGSVDPNEAAAVLDGLLGIEDARVVQMRRFALPG